MDKKLAVIVGVGPLLGKHLGLEFASHGFDVVLIARNEVSLKRFKQEFDERKYNAYIYTADCSDFLSLDKTFDLIVKEHGIPNVFIYNTGITTADPQHLTSTDLKDISGSILQLPIICQQN